ncbi:MAG TPA: hypothetical protein VHR84_15280 [Terriglobales bacterium]|jgi:hypothetical protein|nr:hypothetical protein [Terriglobales bacterium]
MPRNRKPMPVTAHGLPSTFLSLLTGWIEQGVESFFATQRVLVDVAMRQNAALTKTLREGIADRENSPVAILTDLAIEGTSSFMEAQKILLNLAHQQNAMMMDAGKERVANVPRAGAVADLVHRSMDTLIRMQQEFLTITSKQTIQWLEAIKEGKGYQNTHMVELAREAMETFVQSQKKFLDVISEETGKVMSGKHGHVAKPVKPFELSQLADDATESFIDAQKKLLDVLGKQANVNLRAASRAMNFVSPARFLPMANITGEGVKNFVAAEKALIESMVKRGAGAMHMEPAERHAARPVRHKRAKKAHAAVA